MATIVRARDIAHQPSENVKQDFAIAVSQLTLAVQVLASKLDADATVADTNYRAVIDTLLTHIVTAY